MASNASAARRGASARAGAAAGGGARQHSTAAGVPLAFVAQAPSQNQQAAAGAAAMGVALAGLAAAARVGPFAKKAKGPWLRPSPGERDGAAYSIESPLAEGAKVKLDADGHYTVFDKKEAANPFEKTKFGRGDGLKLWTVGGFKELCSKSMEEIDADKGLAADVDMRLKWLGLFHRRKATYGKFMLRLKLANGIANAEQMRCLGEIIAKYGEEGCADLTTRQNFQLRGITLPDVPEIFDSLEKVGLLTLQSGLDSVRNPVGNPMCGVDPEEILDTRPYCDLLTAYCTNYGKGNKEIGNLPRKFNVCVVGTHDLYEHPHINDLAFLPARRASDGQLGFNIIVGGYLSSKRCVESVPLKAFVPEDQLIAATHAVLLTFRDLGNRGNRQKCRLMWLVDELGVDGFRDACATRLPEGVAFEPEQPSLIDETRERRSYFGVNRAKQPGENWVGLHVPVGRMLPQDFFDLADLAELYGDGEVRTTVEQNIVLAGVKDADVEKLLAHPVLEKFTPFPDNVAAGTVSCTGSQFCGMATVETKVYAEKFMREIASVVETPDVVRMHFTGCPNTCAQSQIADIGFLGVPAKNAAGEPEEGWNIFMGGQIGHLSEIGDIYKEKVPKSELVEVVADIMVEKFGGKRKEKVTVPDVAPNFVVAQGSLEAVANSA